MVGLESSMDLAESAKKVKIPKVAEAERKRQKEFMEQLRSRSAPQPLPGVIIDTPRSQLGGEKEKKRKSLKKKK